MRKDAFPEKFEAAWLPGVTYFLMVELYRIDSDNCFNPENHYLHTLAGSARLSPPKSAEPNRFACNLFHGTLLERERIDPGTGSSRRMVASKRMSILVICPNCGKRFQAGEKHAGKTGPCPNCKKPLKVPTQTEQAVPYTPEEFEEGGRSPDGRLITKPTARRHSNFNLLMTVTILAAALLIFTAAFVGGQMGVFKNSFFFSALGLMLISPLLTLAAYSFLYNDELEPYKGKSLIIRATICGFIYALLWGIFTYLANFLLTGEIWNWFFIAPPFLAAGATVAFLALDLEIGNGFFHYSFYLLATIVIRWIAGLGWILNVK
jgi:hypothetical protein